MPESSISKNLHTCDYCGLIFRGPGYSPDDEHRFCCYGCSLIQRIVGSQGGQGVAAWLLLRFGAGASLAMNVMMLSLVLYTNPTVDSANGLRWAMAGLATPAWLILASPFISGCVRDLRRGRLSTDALIVTGSTAAYGVSLAHVIAGRGHVYFDSATMLLLIVTLGRLLEASAKSRASQALHDTVGMIPDKARVIRDGAEQEIPSGEVQVGDTMLVKPGEHIPADGVIVAGSCMIEEAAFTGEVGPRSAAPGDRVFGGSVNYDGLITVEATDVGSDSLLSRIRTLVEEAEIGKAPIERLAERTSSIFLPIVWVAAFGALAFWDVIRHDIDRGVLSSLAVLVVACPCALGLATPMATAIAIGKAAGAGVLIRSGEVLERLSKIHMVFFDKTGTLTDGLLSVSDIATGSEVSADEALSWAAQLEAGSEHAIAQAIVSEAKERGLHAGTLDGFRAFPGLGATGLVDIEGETRHVTAGSANLLSDEHELPEDLYNVLGHGRTTVYVGWDGRVHAAIMLEDQPRDEAHSSITGLKVLGIEPAVISGDGEEPVSRLAAELGIDAVFAEQTPDQKVEAIREARESEVGLIAMVGDGINDAPALAEADVGIAIGSGTDLARESSDVTLLGDDLSRIPWLLDLSKKTCRIIRQNLWWSFGYNSIAVCLAFMGFVHPLIAAVAMFASSFLVIANSMRILGNHQP